MFRLARCQLDTVASQKAVVRGVRACDEGMKEVSSTLSKDVFRKRSRERALTGKQAIARSDGRTLSMA